MVDDRSPNWVDKTVWTGDNLQVMRGMNSGAVDLIYLDPPFNSKKDYAAPVGSQAAGSAFKDTWTLSDIDVEWLNLIEEKHPALWRVLMAAPTLSDKSYLVYMVPRLLETKRLLRRSGSIYLHCDPRMSHYLKLVMDAVFGRKAFRNEVVWRRTKGRSDGNRWGRVHDVILFYTTGPEWTWNRQYLPHDPDYVKKQYRHVGEHGRWQSGDLTASGTRRGESGQPWRGIDPTDKGRHWNTPTQGGMNTWIVEQNLIPGWPDAYPSVHARLDILDEAGLVHWPKDGRGTPRLKRYLESTRGRAVPDMFLDIGKLEDSAPEKIGFRTQKPLALLDRIIKASSDPGDVVFDPFCGCATTLVAADDLDRRWVGIDISAKAADLVVERIQERQGLFRNIVHRTDQPHRTDLGKLPPYNCKENRQALYGLQEGYCAGCDIHFELRNLDTDHIIADTKGGTDHLDNLQLLCGHCNRTKGDRGMEYLNLKLRITGRGKRL